MAVPTRARRHKLAASASISKGLPMQYRNWARVCACVSACALLAIGPTSFGATSAGPSLVDQSLFQAMRWRGIGPYRGGRVLAVTGVPGEPYVFYFGAVAGGIW